MIGGNPDASEEELKRAIDNAYLTDFVQSIPEGLEKRVGERGNLLSRGQILSDVEAKCILLNVL